MIGQRVGERLGAAVKAKLERLPGFGLALVDHGQPGQVQAEPAAELLDVLAGQES